MRAKVIQKSRVGGGIEHWLDIGIIVNLLIKPEPIKLKS